MPGGFAHLLAAREALHQRTCMSEALETDLDSLPTHAAFVQLGSVGPDFPYFGGQTDWADRMHQQETGLQLSNGIKAVRAYHGGPARQRALAWLYGYASHMAVDLTIHPVIERLVGPYEQNQRAHRICEMHQDAYLWHFRDPGDEPLASFFDRTIEACSSASGALSDDVTDLWSQMVARTFPHEVVQTPPDFLSWSVGFRTILQASDGLGELFPFSRHIFSIQGLTYPDKEQIDPSSINALPSPQGLLSYGDLFDRAIESVLALWRIMDRAIMANTPDDADKVLALIPNGNLDTGVDLRTGSFTHW